MKHVLSSGKNFARYRLRGSRRTILGQVAVLVAVATVGVAKYSGCGGPTERDGSRYHGFEFARGYECDSDRGCDCEFGYNADECDSESEREFDHGCDSESECGSGFECDSESEREVDDGCDAESECGSGFECDSESEREFDHGCDSESERGSDFERGSNRDCNSGCDRNSDRSPSITGSISERFNCCAWSYGESGCCRLPAR